MSQLNLNDYFSFKNGVILDIVDIEKINNKYALKIESVRESDSGQYKISASNPAGADEATWTVVVEGILSMIKAICLKW